jgi:superfamily I DNA/RNA helicase
MTNVPSIDYLFVDECQDLNLLQIQFINKCITPATKVVCVGDRNQSIYVLEGLVKRPWTYYERRYGRMNFHYPFVSDAQPLIYVWLRS